MSKAAQQADADRCFMQLAARLAARGHGYVEPNPMVGCVIVSSAGEVVALGWHQRFGQAHAEVNALAMAGDHARGSTCYVTLEPCDHQGKTGPCTQALINAGVGRVIIARRDPNPAATGGAQRLTDAGIDVVFRDDLLPCAAPSDPFEHRLRTGLPWVIAKWAQTLDGRTATRTGASQWISSPASRRCVHRERGRVDVILTATGTVLADDPMLTARGVRVRRTARRVVYDPKLQTPLDAKLVRTACDVPTTICCMQTMLTDPRCQAFRDANVDLLGLPLAQGNGVGRPLSSAAHHQLLPTSPQPRPSSAPETRPNPQHTPDVFPGISGMLREMVHRYDAATVLVESGGGLLGRLFAANLVNEAWVFVAPLLLGDEQARAAVRGMTTPQLADGVVMNLVSHHTRGGDIMLRYRVGPQAPGRIIA